MSRELAPTALKCRHSPTRRPMDGRPDRCCSEGTRSPRKKRRLEQSLLLRHPGSTAPLHPAALRRPSTLPEVQIAPREAIAPLGTSLWSGCGTVPRCKAMTTIRGWIPEIASVLGSKRCQGSSQALMSPKARSRTGHVALS
jgi:hypothetical protein